MVSINTKLVSQLNLKQTTVKASNEEDSKATGNKVDSTGQPYNPGKSVGDLKADTLIVNWGIKIGGGKPLDVEAPKAEECAISTHLHAARELAEAYSYTRTEGTIYCKHLDGKFYMLTVNKRGKIKEEEIDEATYREALKNHNL